MNRKHLNIVLIGFLISNLLFSQLVINLLHDRHDAHEPHVELSDGQAALQKHGEHCKICSLDILFNLDNNASLQLVTQHQGDNSISTHFANEKSNFVSLSQGRAPPAFN